MRPTALIDFLRGRGVEIWIHGRQLRARTRDGSAIDPQVADIVRTHARGLGRHLRGLAAYTPTSSPPTGRPNLIGLAARYRALHGESCKDRYHEVTGVDLDMQNPDWPDLYAFDAWLRPQEEAAGIQVPSPPEPPGDGPKRTTAEPPGQVTAQVQAGAVFSRHHAAGLLPGDDTDGLLFEEGEL